MISGALTVWVGPDKLTVGAGGYHIPLNVPHMVQGGAEDTHAILISSPAGFAELVARAGTPAHLATPATEPDQELFMEVTTELGDVVLDPPGATPRGDQALDLGARSKVYPAAWDRRGATGPWLPGPPYTDRHGAARGVGLERHPGRRPRRGGGRHQRRPGPAAAAPIDSDTFRTYYTRPVQRFYEQVAGREIEPGDGRPWTRPTTPAMPAGWSAWAGPDAREALAAAEAARLGQSLLSMWRHQDLVPLVERLGIDRYCGWTGCGLPGVVARPSTWWPTWTPWRSRRRRRCWSATASTTWRRPRRSGPAACSTTGLPSPAGAGGDQAPVVDRLTDAVAYASVS